MDHPRSVIMSTESDTDFWNRTDILRYIHRESTSAGVSAWGLLAALQVNALSYLPPRVVPRPMQASTFENLDLFVALVDDPQLTDTPAVRKTANKILSPKNDPNDTAKATIFTHLGSFRSQNLDSSATLFGDINDPDVSGTMNALARGESTAVQAAGDENMVTLIRREMWRLGAVFSVPCTALSALPRPTDGWLWAYAGDFHTDHDSAGAYEKPLDRSVRVRTPLEAADERKFVEMPPEGHTGAISAIVSRELGRERLHRRLAVGTALLHERIDPTSDDWDAARLQLRVSNALRTWWVGQYGSYRTVFDAVSSVSSDPDVIAVADKLLELIAAAGIDGIRNNDLRRRLAVSRQGRVPSALKLLTKQGLVSKNADKNYYLT